MNEKFTTSADEATRASFNLTTRQHDLLAEILTQQVSSGQSVPALKFRTEYREDRLTLDQLERLLLLRRSDNQYRITGLSVPLLDSLEAKTLMLRMETVFNFLGEHYEIAQDKPLRIADLAVVSNLSLDKTAEAVQLLQDAPQWSGGGSTDLLSEDAYIICRECILDFDSCEALAKEVLSWASSSQTMMSLEVATEPVVISGPLTGSRKGAHTASDGESNDIVVSRQPADIVHAWQAVRSCLLEFRFDEIKDIAGLAGLNLPAVAHLASGSGSGSATKGQLMTAFDGQIAEWGARNLTRMVTTIVEEVLGRKEELQEKMAGDLSRLGWSFAGGVLVPIEIFDIEDLMFVPPAAHKDLIKAVRRMRDGDLSGAIGSACGAVDSATSKVYEDLQLGNPAEASFQERCKKAVQARGVLESLEQELIAAGWDVKGIVPFKRNLEGALNQAAYVLQSLRSEMGDAHGTKPIVRSLAFESIKWAELIVAALTVPDNLQ